MHHKVWICFGDYSKDQTDPNLASPQSFVFQPEKRQESIRRALQGHKRTSGCGAELSGATLQYFLVGRRSAISNCNRNAGYMFERLVALTEPRLDTVNKTLMTAALLAWPQGDLEARGSKERRH